MNEWEDLFCEICFGDDSRRAWYAAVSATHEPLAVVEVVLCSHCVPDIISADRLNTFLLPNDVETSREFAFSAHDPLTFRVTLRNVASPTR